jgi:hypothetical protein
MATKLYETDYLEWTQFQIEALRSRKWDAIDIEGLIEELEELGKSDRDAVESLLTRLYEHIFKIVYWESERERNLNHWQFEIISFRNQINKKLKKQPSLKRYLDEIDAECWSDAFKTARQKFDCLPSQLVTWEIAVTEGWFPPDFF